ncbi:hypothetical protein ACHAPU_006044 [Fusarium lateritium]
MSEGDDEAWSLVLSLTSEREGKPKASSDLDTKACSPNSPDQESDTLVVSRSNIQNGPPKTSPYEKGIADAMKKHVEPANTIIEGLRGTVLTHILAQTVLTAQIVTEQEESQSIRQRFRSLRDEHQKTLSRNEETEEEIEELKDQIPRSDSCLSHFSRRSIIVGILLSRPPMVDPTSGTEETEEPFPPDQAALRRDYKNILDHTLSPRHARGYIEGFKVAFTERNLNSASMLKCSVCRRLKFERLRCDLLKFDIDEFTTGLQEAPTCSNPVCSECFGKSVRTSLNDLREN